MNLPVSDIIRDSFKVAWRHKYLWLFGLFAGGGGGGGLNFPGGSDPGDLEEIKAWVLAALAVIVLVAFVVSIVVLILHTICKSALIYNAYQIETGGAHSLSGGWDFGIKRFWPMLGVTLAQIFVLIGFVLVLGLIEVAVFVASVPIGLLSLLVALPVFFGGLAVVIAMWVYAERFVALESRGVVESIGEGWTLLRAQWRPTIIMLLVKLGIGIAVGMGALCVGLVLGLPAVGIWQVSKLLAVVYGILILAPFVILLGAYFGTFDSVAWTKVFLGLRAPAYASATNPPPSSNPPLPGESRPLPPIFE